MAIYSVAQITKYLKNLLASDSIVSDLWVRGEISNLTKSGAGHFYFTLKDLDSQIRCVMFRPAFGSDHLHNGSAVSLHGNISIYEVRGDVQLYVDMVQPEGVGDLYLEFERLKLTLEQDGLFLESNKKNLPQFPKRIGVVTSPSGSVWHDIQNIIRRRYPIVELCIAPTTVQGDKAAPEIVEAIRSFNSESVVDLLIIARGGGSIEELWPFNEEMVARAIYSSSIPIISAIGHETDYTISDMVADYRAPTPSAAAEIAVPDINDLRDDITFSIQRLTVESSNKFIQYRHALSNMESSLSTNRPTTSMRKQKIDELLARNISSLKSYTLITAEKLRSMESILLSLRPNAVLSRGYAIVENQSKAQIVRSVDNVNIGDTIDITVSDGSFSAKTL